MNRDLNDTLIFAKVVEHGSFISAARSLRLPKTTVSRKIQDLETRLGAQLLHRTTRKLGLTEAGNVYFEHSQRIAHELDEAESAVGQLQGGPRGWLRITAPYSFAISRITPLFGEFQARYPEVRVEMVLTNEQLDLIDKRIDVALRIGQPRDTSLVARRLGVFRSQVYASAEYLARHGEPVHPDDEPVLMDRVVDLFGPDAERLGIVLELFEAAHPAEPAWFLQFVGVDPARQGGGIGSALLRDGLRRADAAGEAAYLEATSELNRALYERHGFRCIEEIRLPDGPTSYGMWREAGATGS